MNDAIASRILAELRSTTAYADLAVSSRPMATLWWTLNDMNLRMRLPLYWRRLRRQQPKESDYQTTIHHGLSLLAAAAAAFGTHQAIISSVDGYVRRISFQPRPFGINWTAEHALLDPDPQHRSNLSGRLFVEASDFLFLSCKVAHLLCRCEPGRLIDAVSTYIFLKNPVGVDARVRDVLSNRTYNATL